MAVVGEEAAVAAAMTAVHFLSSSFYSVEALALMAVAVAVLFHAAVTETADATILAADAKI